MLTISSTALTVIWIVLLVLFLILEAATVQLVSAWFALGELCPLLANLCGVGVIWQIVLFLIVSAICLIATRPLVKKMTPTKIQKTNADRCLGAEAVVLQELNTLKSTGLVKAMGNTWTARAEDGSVIPKDAVVIVRKMDGVKLIVSQQSEKQ